MWSSNLVRQCRRDRFSRDDQGCRRRCNVSRGVRIGDIRNTHFQDQTKKHMRVGLLFTLRVSRSYSLLG